MTGPALPPAVAGLFTGPPPIGRPAQAFPFLTVGDDGMPACCLLSTAEIEAAPDGTGLLVVVAGRRPRANLGARGRATLLAIEGTTLHSCRLTLRSSVEHRGVLAAALDLVGHDADSLGIPLVPLTYTPPPEIAALERWDVSAEALAIVRSTAFRDREPT